jgi:hypothetical protein
VLHERQRNEVLKKGYNTETSSLDVLCDTACMIKEASRYNQGMQRAELLIRQLTHIDLLQASRILHRVLTDLLHLSKAVHFNACHHNDQCKLAEHLRRNRPRRQAVRRSRTTHRSSRRRCGCRIDRRTALRASNVDKRATLGLIVRNSSKA